MSSFRMGIRWLGILGIFAATSLAFSQTPVNRVVATVNGQAISYDDIKAVVEARPFPVTPSTEVLNEMRESAVEMLIDDLLMRQFLDRSTQPPAAGEIDKEIEKLKDVLANQKKSIDDFLLDTKQNQQQLRNDIAAKLRWKSYLATSLTDLEMKQYYDANKIFFDKVFVRASHILIKCGPTAAPAERDQARLKLAELRQQIVTGTASFQDLAKRHSDCPSKDKGGDIGPFPYKFVVVPEFAQVAFSLRVGDVSEVFPTNYGFHVIKVTDRTPGEASSFENLKETVREVFAQDRELYQKILDGQRSKADIRRNVKFSN